MRNILYRLYLKLFIYFFIIIEIVKYFHEKNEEIKSKMYDSLVNETIPFYVNRFEKIVAENDGYFVNGKV